MVRCPALRQSLTSFDFERFFIAGAVVSCLGNWRSIARGKSSRVPISKMCGLIYTNTDPGSGSLSAAEGSRRSAGAAGQA
jgi:hypothetical protein